MAGTRNFIESNKTIQLTPAELEAIITFRVQAALAEAEARKTSEFARNNRPTPGSSGTFTIGGTAPLNQGPRPCLFHDFMACKPSNFHGTEKPVGLLRWLEEARQQANDAMMQTIRRNVLGATNDNPKDNKRKRSENSRGTSYSYLMEKYDVAQPGSSDEEKPGYKSKPPMCTRCEKHHSGYCHVICAKCGRMGHISKNCRNPDATPITTAKHGTGPSSSISCYGCGEVGHFKRNCPKIRKEKGKFIEPSSCTYCGGSQE